MTVTDIEVATAPWSSTDDSVRTRVYVVDTSVLLSDPNALLRFAEHSVVLPVVVITELEAKRHHPELGYFARAALRLLDDLRVMHGRLDSPVAVNSDGGTLKVELTTRTPWCFRPASGWATTTRGSSRWRSTTAPRAPRSCSSARTFQCASRHRRSASMPRSTGPSSPSIPAGPGWPT